MSDAKKRREGAKCRLLFMLCLTGMFFFIELIVGYVTNSMALVADSFHMLSDVIALVIAYISVRISPRKWSKNTFGWARAEVLGALVNAVFLAALCFSILVESIKRFYQPEELHNPLLILIVGAIGLLVNVVGLFMFHGAGGHHHGHSHGHGHGHSHGGHHHGHSHAHGGDEPSHERPLKGIEASALESGKGGLGVSLTTSCQDHIHHRPQSASRESHLSSSSSSTSSPNGSRGPTPEPIMKVGPGAVAVVTAHAKASHTHSHSSTSSERKLNKAPASAANMNMRGVFLHVLADALGSVIVMISATIVLTTEWEYNLYIDPALSVCMVLLILKTTWPLLVESAMILLQTVPTHIQIDTLQRKLLEEIDGVLAVHEFHVWQLAGDRIIASAHIRCRNLHDYMEIAEKVKEFFHNEGIHSTTIQPEFVDIANEEQQQRLLSRGYSEEKGGGKPVDCMFICPPNEGINGCHEQTCCGPQKDAKSTSSSKKISNSDPNLFPNGIQMSCVMMGGIDGVTGGGGGGGGLSPVDGRCSSPDLRPHIHAHQPLVVRQPLDLRSTITSDPTGVTIVTVNPVNPSPASPPTNSTPLHPDV